MDLLGTRFGLLTVVWMSCFLVQIRCVLANEMWPYVDEMNFIEPPGKLGILLSVCEVRVKCSCKTTLLVILLLTPILEREVVESER
jgi:hypothetical protein